jgi:polar amino acid transport system permease protein
MNYQWDFSLIVQNFPVLLRGLGVTLELWLLAGISGTVIGLLLGIARTRPQRWMSLLTRSFVEVFRNTPVLIQLIWFYYAFPVLVGIQFSTFGAALLALTLYTAAYSTEIFRAGLQSIERGQ